MKCVISAASEFKGRFIAYGGGSGIFVFSNEVAAKAQQAAEMAQQIPDPTLTVQTMVSIGGLVVIAGRLALDIFKEVDKRRNGKNKNKSEGDND
ncbi:hypothetical protein KO537_22485 [Shewanella sp. NKUCC01_JLK]|uniref:hypothetical protein n=1 Tax=unclassified Shewanella TaxID=196818 RepID=UPI001565D727|nr:MULTISPECIES: hypothetical protein [unclassified Shewanella]MBW3517459.1 hypothetical protein [Shewanella sp. NKUCC01_JLK]NRD34562.1 hypothetical protein [Shewanella sp. DC2-4]